MSWPKLVFFSRYHRVLGMRSPTACYYNVPRIWLRHNWQQGVWPAEGVFPSSMWTTGAKRASLKP
ncbi:rrna processing protein nop9 [Moniliophthora roreri]|nr:rrna processing protein nop9 [Moniliophthora roreri]